MPANQKKIMVFGTFDIFHKGHESYLNQARKHGDYLVAVIARDANVRKIKGEWPVNNEKKRLQNLKESRLADQAVLGSLRNKYEIIRYYKPDVICLGYDQKVNIAGLKKNLLAYGLKNVKIKRLKAHKPGLYKSSKLK